MKLAKKYKVLKPFWAKNTEPPKNTVLTVEATAIPGQVALCGKSKKLKKDWRLSMTEQGVQNYVEQGILKALS